MSSELKDHHIEHVWTKARAHYEASKVGLPSDFQNYERCNCCDQPIKKKPIPMSQNTKEFEIFGFGYPLYFSFLKYCILLVIILVASRTATSLYMATKENYDFCYGNHETNAVASGHVQKPHHFEGESAHNNAHIDLRHFDENHSNSKMQHQGEFLSGQFHKGHSQNSSASFHPKTVSQDGDGHEDHGHQEHHAECTSFMIYFSIFKGEQEFENYFLRIVGFAIHLIALIGIRNMLSKEGKYYDERTCSLSDYSVLVSNIPKIYNTGKSIRKLFKEMFGKDTEVKELIYIFKDEKLQVLEERIKELQKEQLKAIESNDHGEVAKIKKEIQKEEQQLQKELKFIRATIDKDYVECDKVIVILNTENDKDDVLERFEMGPEKINELKQKFKVQHQKRMSRSKLKLESSIKNDSNKKASDSKLERSMTMQSDQTKDIREWYNTDTSNKNFSSYFSDTLSPDTEINIKIHEAPQPNEIIWEHIEESDIKRKALIFQGWLLTILFLGVVTVVFYFIMSAKAKLFSDAVQLQHHHPDNPLAHSKKVFATVIVFVALFGVILFNKFIMGKVLHIFVHLERHAYTDKEGFSFAMKYSLGMFFTTALMTLAVEAVKFNNFYTHQYGVIEQETIMFFVTAFFIPLVWLIHPYNLAKKVEYMFNRNKLVTQQKANEMIEDFPYDLGKRYAEIFQIMWFTFLYSELIPVGSFLILIGLSLYYWVDKYNFLRRSALKQGMSGKMSILSLKSLDATLFLAHAGRVLFAFLVQGKVDYLGMGMAAFAIIYLFMPIQNIIDFFNEEKFMSEEKTYDQASVTFKQHYRNLHPVYKSTHKEENEELREEVINYYKKKMQMEVEFQEEYQKNHGEGWLCCGNQNQNQQHNHHHPEHMNR